MTNASESKIKMILKSLFIWSVTGENVSRERMNENRRADGLVFSLGEAVVGIVRNRSVAIALAIGTVEARERENRADVSEILRTVVSV